MSNEKIISFAISCFLIVLIVFGNYGCCEQNNKIKIGAVLPLSGDNANYGKWIKEGLDLKLGEINQKDGIDGESIEIIYEDDEALPSKGVSAIQKLINVDDVSVIIGSWASSSVLAMAPIAEKQKKILMAIALSPKIKYAGDYIFRIQPDANYYIKKLAPYLVDSLSYKDFSIFYINNDFGEDQRLVFTEEVTKLGAQIISTYAFDQGEQDFRTQLAKLKKDRPEVIFAPAYIELGRILKQAKEINLITQFVGSVPSENEDILKIAGEAAEGLIYPHHFDPESKSKVVVEYQDEYQAKYGRKSEGFAALAYDGLGILAEIMGKCQKDAGCIKDSLYDIKYEGVTGISNFDKYGDVEKTIVIKTVKKGQFVKK